MRKNMKIKNTEQNWREVNRNKKYLKWIPLRTSNQANLSIPYEMKNTDTSCYRRTGYLWYSITNYILPYKMQITYPTGVLFIYIINI